jgi:pyruvate/oxaloacetate carboxyltransferase
MSEQLPIPTPSEPGSRENPHVVKNSTEGYYGGYAGDRNRHLDTRIVGGSEAANTMQAAADSLQREVDARAAQAEEQMSRPLAPGAITEVPDFTRK